MHTISELPALPTIKFYQIRMLSNDISAFNRDIIHYDPLIFERVKRIVIQTENLNELVRSSLPALKLKTNDIINSTLNGKEPPTDALTSESDQEHYKFTLLDFIENFSDVKEEIDKLQMSLRSSTDLLLAFKLETQNQLRNDHFIAKRTHLLASLDCNKLKIEELTHDVTLISQAEEIILKHKLSDMFDKFFPEKDLIDTVNITTSKKDLLKAAIACATRLLRIIDNGLEFMSLINIRLYLSDRINSLHENTLHLETRITRLTFLISLAKDISNIEDKKQHVAHDFQSFQLYLQQWSDFLESCLVEHTFNIYKAIKSCGYLMEFIVDTEYQYQRQLAD
ncbi:alpha-xenorhabdolysin family binary toxin subunit B [Providencia burhodogranariea]|uniref:XaxB n=1 Tax=Providencia burhodogranariea DSM 19968 TaxID=1141662 RepID=K8WTD6_9GAMM|nr:alpha-xenorhabdolysin family binary toxin subunit B [Providencia burhodogranariea]EKT63884.1 XaxB [Providencia burhodogranariea DSM 19968]